MSLYDLFKIFKITIISHRQIKLFLQNCVFLFSICFLIITMFIKNSYFMAINILIYSITNVYVYIVPNNN